MASRPIAFDDSFDFFEDQVISGNVLANDQDSGGGPIYLRYFDGARVDAKQGPAQETQIAGDYGLFTVKPDGSFTYQLDPAIVLEDGDTLVETLSTKIAGAGGTDVGSFTLTIHGKSPPPRAPVATEDRFEFAEGDSYTGNVLANDYDLNGDALFLRFFDGVRVNAKLGITQETQIAGDHGTFTVRPDGTFTYVLNAGEAPSAGGSLTERLSLKIADSTGRTDVSTFTLVINGGVPSLVNQTEEGNGGTTDAGGLAISADGRLIAFESYSTNLDAGDTNGDFSDIFVLDRQTGIFTNITEGANGYSYWANMSSDGAFVSFSSTATNLVAGDSGIYHDVFLYDVANDTFRNVTQGGNGQSVAGRLSANGATLVFISSASNLTPGDTNNATDLFVYDVATGTLANLGAANFYDLAPISADGSKLVLQTLTALVPEDTDTLSDVYLYDVATGAFSLVSGGVAGSVVAPVLSADGSTIAFYAYEGYMGSAYIHDVASGQTTNIAPLAEENSSTIISGLSADGKTAVFTSTADNLVPDDIVYMFEDTNDVFVYDVETGSITSITKGAFGFSHQASISQDGSTVTFASDAAELTEGVPYGGEYRFRYDVASGRLINMTAELGASGFFETNSVQADDGSVSAFYAYDRNAADLRFDLYTYELL